MSVAVVSRTFSCWQAAQETKHKMGPAANKIYLIHFNDVYNVESSEEGKVTITYYM